MEFNSQNDEIKEKLKKYVSDIFYKKVSEINISNTNLPNADKPNTDLLNSKSLDDDNIGDYCVFNKAPQSGLWYNWATNVGEKYCAISYSAGTTWLFNNNLPLTNPIIYIFKTKDIKCENINLKPEFELEIPNLEANGVRSLLLIEDDINPYCLIGTFEYPNNLKSYNTKLLKWNFISNQLNTIIKIKQDNSIRQIIRYINCHQDLILFSTQNDSFNDTISKLYWIKKNDIDCSIKNNLNYIKLLYKEKYITGSIWDFYIDSDTVYVSIPALIIDENKLSGYKILARLFYFNINNLFYFFGSRINRQIKVHSLIGNCKYPNGFNISSISTVQVISNSKSKYVYIYTLSDFLYQFNFIINNPNILEKIINKLNIQLNQLNLLDTILELRKVILDFDIEGTRIFKFKKSDLYKNDILISTIVGEPPFGTLNLSNTTNGFNSYTNLYTWCATSNNNDFYFGTLDLRSQIYNLIALLTSLILSNPQIYQFLLSLPESQIIIITELFNPNFCIGNLTDLSNKKLYFDIINIKSNFQDKITSSGFNTNDGLNQFADDGVRNLNIIYHGCHKYLLVGTTCYQPINVAKNYLVKIK
jgi:hypothetical protein